MVQRPEDREAAARSVIEANGGRLLSFYWMFGDHDGLAIYETPDAIVAAIVLAGIRSSGRIARLMTRSLLTGEEAQRVLDHGQVRPDHLRPAGRTARLAPRVREP